MTNARIQHVSIPRPLGSDSQARAFYGDLLGLTEVPPPSSLSGVIWYRLGDTELHLFCQDEDDGVLARHLCIEVKDLEGVRERLTAGGYQAEDTTAIPGRPRFFCLDPFGNRLEFTKIEGDYLTAQG